MLTESKAIILHARKYGENGRILNLYCQSSGLTTLFVRSIGNTRKGGIGAYLEPMTRVQVSYESRRQSGLPTLKEISPFNSGEILFRDMVQGAIAIFMAELTHAAVTEGEEDQALFDFLWTWVDTMHAKTSRADIPLRFMLSLSDVLGFGPDRASEGIYFDLREGVFTAVPSHKDHLDAESSSFLRAVLIERSSRGLADAKRKRERLLTHLIAYYKVQIPGFKGLKSHLILTKVLGADLRTSTQSIRI